MRTGWRGRRRGGWLGRDRCLRLTVREAVCGKTGRGVVVIVVIAVDRIVSGRVSGNGLDGG